MEITPPSPKPRTAVVTCAVLEQEVDHFRQGMDHIVHVEILPQGLHNEPERLRRDLQEAILRVEEKVEPEAIVLGYGLCSRGTEGVLTKRALLVIARAHDCITHLLGCKSRYAEYVGRNPGTYWYSPGWNKHHVPPGERRYLLLLRQYTEQYGEDNAEYLMESEQQWFSTYDRATYVDLGVGATPEDLQYTRECAEWLNWSFDRQHGDPELLKSLLDCEWDDDRFLVLRPGQVFRMTADERVVELAP